MEKQICVRFEQQQTDGQKNTLVDLRANLRRRYVCIALINITNYVLTAAYAYTKNNNSSF